MVKPGGQDRTTETRILDAADAVFVRRGTDGARMQEIADEAGVNKALLHYYYRTKEHLAQAVFLRAIASFLPSIFEIMASDLPLDEKIEHFVTTYLDQLSRRPYLPGYILSEMTHHPDRAVEMFSSTIGDVPRQVLRKLKKQIDEGAKLGVNAPMTAGQFIVSLIGSCVFPFAARPMLVGVLGIGPKGFDRFIEQRRKELPAFLKRAIKP